ncbi:MAG: hypothetical protein QOF50_1639, partial [Gaiellaceae bacterium]|nr:hypothetical protein [Gaiellaceae bacterium]
MHWAAISALASAGHDVTFVSLPWADDPPTDERIEEIRGLGAEVVVVPPPPGEAPAGRWQARAAYVRSLTWPGDETLFPSIVSAPGLAGAVAELAPDVVLADGNTAIVAAAGLEVPKLASMCDPPGLSRRLRTRYEPLYPWRLGRDELLYRLGAATYAFRADRRMVDLLRRFDSVAVYAAHRAEWAREQGVNAWYARSPMLDPVGDEWAERRAQAPPNAKPRILMIGHLRGISTISGLHVFVEDVLPRLTDELGPDGFEVHVVGAYDPPRSLRSALDHPAVILRGQIEPPDEEFLRADVVLVPTPVETGPRIRILSAFAYGCCVVAHSANRLGIPALEHGANALLADEAGLAGATLQALRDPALREGLGAAGRAVYEESFTPERAGT